MTRHTWRIRSASGCILISALTRLPSGTSLTQPTTERLKALSGASAVETRNRAIDPRLYLESARRSLCDPIKDPCTALVDDNLSIQETLRLRVFTLPARRSATRPPADRIPSGQGCALESGARHSAGWRIVRIRSSPSPYSPSDTSAARTSDGGCRSSRSASPVAARARDHAARRPTQVTSGPRAGPKC